MRFCYSYKTSDGVQHEGTYEASSRPAVYDELKRKGIKPFNVRLAPGFLNGIRSIGKRWFAIVVLAIAAVVLSVALIRTEKRIDDGTGPLPRHFIYGDPARMAEFERTDYASVFADEGDRLLARFAQPGVAVVSDVPASVLSGCLKSEVVVLPEDEREVAELKRIVLWMKDELREYLSDGEGTVESYLKRLNQRQRQELDIQSRVMNELRNDKSAKTIERCNESLRKLGLKTVVFER